MICPEDKDFTESYLEDKNTCPECEEYKNERRELCDACIFSK